MKIYQSSLTLNRIKKANSRYLKFVPNVLYAYNFDYNKNNNELVDLIENKNMTNSLIVDSGMYNLNKTMTPSQRNCFDEEAGFNELCMFYGDFKDKIDFYFTYDILFECNCAYIINKNYFERMLELGLNPVYILHSFERHEIDYTKDINPQYVAIASALLGNNKEKIKQSLAVIEELYESGIKVHLLGRCSYEILKQSKAWSCDASSYARHGIKEKLIYFSNILQKEKIISLTEFTSDGKFNKDYFENEDMKIFKNEYSKFIETEAGITFDEIDEDKSLAKLANAYYMIFLEKMITEIQKKNGVDFTQDKFKIKNINNMPDW